MAIVAPFKGLTYNFNRFQDLSTIATPPYDVISEDEQEAYYKKDPHNVIRLILGKKKKGDTDLDNRYTRSADLLRKWQKEDILVRTREPGLYYTSLSYDAGDGSGPKERWGLIALVKIEEDDSRVILPHERTFSAHKIDRLNLMRACNTQLSQVFGLFHDPDLQIFNCFRNIIEQRPLTSFEFEDGTKHKMWMTQDFSIFKQVAEVMRDKNIFIADGHHRYETARNYRNLMRARHGGRAINRSYDFLTMYLSNMADKGLTILPAHRLIKTCKGFNPESFFSRIKSYFEITELLSPVPETSRLASEFRQELEAKGREDSAIGFLYRESGRGYLLSLKPDAWNNIEEDLHPVLKGLDVIVLSRLILEKVLGFSREDMDDEQNFHYQSNMEKAVSSINSSDYQLAFLLNPTKIDQVKEIAGNSLIMPRKSTYFYPKVLSGLVFNKIDPHESITVY